MTQATLIRKQAELDELIRAHRVVRATLPFGVEVLECVAPLDIPEIGVLTGETFWLASSSHEGYCYPITTTINYDLQCPCEGFFHRHSCKHAGRVSALAVAKYRAIQATAIAHVVLGEEFTQDLEAHVEDSIENGDFVDPFAGLSAEEKRYRLGTMYPDDYGYSAA